MRKNGIIGKMEKGIKIPRHIAIILDGNRRWARQRGLSPMEGHRAGARNLEQIVDYCQKLGVRYLTVYALSTENWKKRARREVKAIFDLLVEIARRKKEEYKRRGIKMMVLGNFQAFPLRVRRVIEEILRIVVRNEVMRFNIALNYGGRDEIVRAIRKMIEDGVKPGEINEELVHRYLYTNDCPDPDLVIRTGGEIRLSNFLLWQLSYSELYFTDTLWPDFGPKELEKAILEYHKRERRFGR